MKKIMLTSIFFLLPFLILTSLGQSPTESTNSPGKDVKSFGLFKSSFLQIDLKAIDPKKGQYGLDYNLALKRSMYSYTGKSRTLSIEEKDKTITTVEVKSVKSINIGLSSKGFVTLEKDANPNNSIINEFKLEGIPLFELGRKYQFVKSRELIDLYQRGDTSLVDGTEGDFQTVADKILPQITSPFYLSANLHIKHETTQDFKNYDFALGASLGISSSYLSTALDIPFQLLRTEGHNNPVPVFLFVGYDYVTGINNTTLADLQPDLKHLNRLNLKGEWQTGIFTNRTRIGFLYDSYYNLNSISPTNSENKSYNRFFMVRLDHYLSKLSPIDNSSSEGDLIATKSVKTLTKLSVKYTQGQLPPNFVTGYVVGAGFSLEF